MAWSGLEWVGVAWSDLEWVGVAWSGLEWVGAQFDEALFKHSWFYSFNIFTGEKQESIKETQIS